MGLTSAYNEQYGSGMAPPVQAKGETKKSGDGTGVIASSLLSSLSSIATGFINAGARKDLAKFNAGMAEIEGRMAQTSAKFEIARIRRRSDQLFSKQRALYAKAGVKLEGSPAEVMLASLREAETDALITQINADYFGFQKSTEGAIYKMRAAGATGDAIMNSGAVLLNAVSQAAAAQARG